MINLDNQLHALDTMVSKGEILESINAFYHENCTFTEMAGGATRANRKDQHEHLSGFFASLKGFNGATLHSSATDGDVSLSEWTFDMTAGDGSSIVWNEVLVRHWRDGKVIKEKYYNASA